MKLTIHGKEVSRGYLQLTTNIAKQWGLDTEFIDNSITLANWEVKTPDIVQIPSEMSLYPMAILLDNLHEKLQVEVESQDIDELLLDTLEVLENPDITKVNLRDGSDVITPAAALMAISEGGEIIGASHTKGKETDRIIRIGQGTSKSIEHPDGDGTIEIWTGGYHAFDKLAGIYEWTSGAYDKTNLEQCKTHTKFIP